MTRVAVCKRVPLVVALSLVTMSGCAQPRMPSPFAQDITPSRQQRRQTAMEQFDRSHDDAQYHAALSAWESGNLAGCRTSLASLLERNPDHFEANYLLAELYFLNDQPHEARTILERLSREQPDLAIVQHTLAMVLARLEERELAQERLELAASLEPHNQKYRDSLDRFRAETVRAGGGQHRLAAHFATSGAEAADFDVQDHHGLHSTRHQFAEACRQRDELRAKNILLEAAERSRGEQTELILLALMALRQDRPAWAVQVLETFETADAATAAYYRTLGTAYYRVGEYNAAEAELRQSLLLDNTSPLSYFLLGCTLTRQRRDQDASVALRQARLLDPRFDRPPVF